ncbi:MAG: transcriptional regulator [Candidatus Omnitrophica bacterium CG07_land_8_20_14_0_80_42_15]|uniref:Transcriptional regulator n=1 Tax=Candidatus Aquitaenariimonas noxiae TaxID=1974741 RepID=A0A2J0L1F4_9BACT|nr:MAG: transcriptional regulator [Candidatus Omnitrophica bacterium CG07_land_8_20_14_0_80_42_15]
MKEHSLTTKQKVVYDYVKNYLEMNKRSPFIREIQEACQINSYKGAVDKLLALEKKGYITRKLNKHRGIMLNGAENN